jgi:hypothetical protein
MGTDDFFLHFADTSGSSTAIREARGRLKGGYSINILEVARFPSDRCDIRALSIHASNGVVVHAIIYYVACIRIHDSRGIYVVVIIEHVQGVHLVYRETPGTCKLRRGKCSIAQLTLGLRRIANEFPARRRRRIGIASKKRDLPNTMQTRG